MNWQRYCTNINQITMNEAMDITEDFKALYYPKAALLVYQTDKEEPDTYVEYFDINGNGHPVNAHPLTMLEAERLSKALQWLPGQNRSFLQPQGILPANVLHILPSANGSVLWYTKAQERMLYFAKQLEIPDGKAHVPTLLWHANRESLCIYALASDRRPVMNTSLYHAPFFNVYEDGDVCMGTVDVNIKASASLEEFMAAWEKYFFNSYFSHLINGHNPVKSNCVSLWKKLLGSGEPFPKEILKKNKRTLKNILS